MAVLSHMGAKTANTRPQTSPDIATLASVLSFSEQSSDLAQVDTANTAGVHTWVEFGLPEQFGTFKHVVMVLVSTGPEAFWGGGELTR